MTGPLPELQPNSKLYLFEKFCNIWANLSYNNLTGPLPQCIGCYIKNPVYSSNFAGNNFTNYKEGEIYPNCTITITKAVLSLQALKLYGTNFPLYESEITSDPVLYNRLYGLNSTQISYFLSTSPYNMLKSHGYIDVHFKTPNITVRSPKFILESPIISNIRFTPLLNLGYTFQAVGFNFGTNYSVVKVDIPPYKCFVTYLDDYVIRCDLYNKSILEQQYSFNFNMSGSITKKSFNFVRSYPIISTIIPVPVSGGNITMYGYFGPNPQNVSVVLTVLTVVNTKYNCTDAVVNSSIIGCYLGPIIIPNDIYYQLIISAEVDGLSTFGGYTVLDDRLPCSNSGCGNHGACTTLGCVCYEGFRGAKCDLIADNPNIVVNSTGAHFGDDDGSFTFSIVSVRELTPFGVLVSETPIDKWIPKGINTSNGEIHSIFEFKKNNFTITSDFEEIISEKNITFAGIEMNLQPGSIKLSITLSSWQYISSVNYLQVVLNSTADFNQCDEDGSGDNGIETDGNLNFLQIKKGGKVFYGQFLNKVLSDQRATIVSNQIISEDDNSILIGLNLPHCNECVIDPNFSVLVDSEFNNDDCKSSLLKDKPWFLPVVVVIPIVSVAIIGAASYVIIKKNQLIKFNNKLEKIKNKW
ncbi:tenascin C [Tieghemostelium lacteum]|uniref:Tenascin C n=1 Tax=Tieghemostelium lacteum TaxID=361077 RepID=A0A152A4Q7_TIELA|nr:tenascin C [Tieghemostelium lacteum]|eukprot:KYR01065.1 tenascin C [Tieghemostelium lacteum]